ncbi:mediator of RNA polymerase II transcription subunit 15a-like [Ananas comosus]|uniref:Mediator of RNA polymerase II transcription subunit 15a-like n=1 Tax=Ananas comosus TaxID=4615 RepID=A0A6P5EGW7_ANACO|nr:mediator of RNA polymerase II transcription subunit 15a-like [Ananas comosus]
MSISICLPSRCLGFAGMEGTNGSTSRSEGVAAVGANGADWRAQLETAARQRIVNKIIESLKRHLPISVPEGINELNKIAVRFEEKIYTTATSQADYLKKISLKLLSMESKSGQAPAGHTTVPNISHVDQIPIYPDHDVTGELQNLNLETEI